MNQLFRISAFAITAMLLAGCSDEQDSAKTSSAPAETTKQPYHPVFNPSPEDIAKREAAEKAALPLTNELPEVSKAGRENYANMGDPLMPMKVYLANRSWDETPEQVAEDLGKLGYSLEIGRDEGIPEDLYELTIKYAREQNAFQKADYLKAIIAKMDEMSATMRDKRLVKVVMKDMAKIMPYDMANRHFQVDTSLFTDRTEYTKEEQEAMDRARRILFPLKGYMYNSNGSYRYAFTGASSLETIKVEDESVARAIESARMDGSIVVYGYVQRTQRNHVNGVPSDKPYVYIQPHFADIVSASGETLHTIEL